MSPPFYLQYGRAYKAALGGVLGMKHLRCATDVMFGVTGIIRPSRESVRDRRSLVERLLGLAPAHLTRWECRRLVHNRTPKSLRRAVYLFRGLEPKLLQSFDAFGFFRCQIFRFAAINGKVVKLPLAPFGGNKFPVTLTYGSIVIETESRATDVLAAVGRGKSAAAITLGPDGCCDRQFPSGVPLRPTQ